VSFGTVLILDLCRGLRGRRLKFLNNNTVQASHSSCCFYKHEYGIILRKVEDISYLKGCNSHHFCCSFVKRESAVNAVCLCSESNFFRGGKQVFLYVLIISVGDLTVEKILAIL